MSKIDLVYEINGVAEARSPSNVFAAIKNIVCIISRTTRMQNCLSSRSALNDFVVNAHEDIVALPHQTVY